MKLSVLDLRKSIGFIVLACFLLGGRSQAAYDGYPMETVTLPGGYFHLGAGEMKTVRLSDGWRRVEKIFVRTHGTYSDAMFEVIANGEVKGTIHVPGRDPSYVVTIKEVVNSLQFRHISGGTVVVHDIKAVQSERYFPCQYDWEDDVPFRHEKPIITRHGVDFPAPNTASFLARRAIRLTDLLEGYANYAEYGEYLLPIKKAAGRAYAVAAAKGDLSWDTRMEMLRLKRQIEYATDYLNETFERSNAFELAVELVSLGEKLDAVLR